MITLKGQTFLSQEECDTLWEFLFCIPDERFIHGRTAAYWNVLATLDSHIVDDSDES